MTFDNGVDGLAFYSSASGRAEHEPPCKVSCAHCGSRITDEGRRMVLLFPTLIGFRGAEERAAFAPE